MMMFIFLPLVLVYTRLGPYQSGGIQIAEPEQAINVKNPQDKTQMTRCDSPLPELEVPMINTMVACLGSEHRKLDDLIMQLACAATRLASDPGAVTANERVLQVWDEIRHDLRSH